MACYLQSGIQSQSNIWDGIFYKNSWRAILENNFRKKIHLIFHPIGSEIASDLKHSDKEYIYLTTDILRIIYYVVKAFINEFKEKETFYFEKGRQFPDEFVSVLLFLFSN